jgi:hypothetical protein
MGCAQLNIRFMASATEQTVLLALSDVIKGAPVDWPSETDTGFYSALPPLALHHGVDVLVCHLLKSTPAWERFPEATREALLLSLRQAAAIELVRKHDLLALLQAARQIGVRLLLLKGGALAYTHYPEPHLRPRVDTDIFIDLADIPAVKAMFSGLGQQLVGHTYKSHQFNSLRTDIGGGTINYDVHWRSNNRSIYARVIRHAEALRESVEVPGLGGARTLKPAHALLQACMHRAGNPAHDPDRLIWLFDIHLLASRMPEAELLEFAGRAVDENLQEICREALEKAAACFATGLPAGVMELLAAPVTAPDSFNQRFSNSQLGLIIDDLRELPDMRSRGALIREYLAPPGDYLLNRYGKEKRIWVPLLYCRYLAGGVIDRLSLK